MGGRNLDMIHAEFHRKYVLIRVAHLPAGVEPILDDDRGLYSILSMICVIAASKWADRLS
jgi:hypothetical protein